MLCTTCSDINFAKYFQTEVGLHRNDAYFVRPNHDAVRLGSLTEIYSRREACRFCRLAVSSFFKRWSPIEWYTPEEFLKRSYKQGFGEQGYL